MLQNASVDGGNDSCGEIDEEGPVSTTPHRVPDALDIQDGDAWGEEHEDGEISEASDCEVVTTGSISLGACKDSHQRQPRLSPFLNASPQHGSFRTTSEALDNHIDPAERKACLAGIRGQVDASSSSHPGPLSDQHSRSCPALSGERSGDSSSAEEVVFVCERRTTTNANPVETAEGATTMTFDTIQRADCSPRVLGTESDCASEGELHDASVSECDSTDPMAGPPPPSGEELTATDSDVLASHRYAAAHPSVSYNGPQGFAQMPATSAFAMSPPMAYAHPAMLHGQSLEGLPQSMPMPMPVTMPVTGFPPHIVSDATPPVVPGVFVSHASPTMVPHMGGTGQSMGCWQGAMFTGAADGQPVGHIAQPKENSVSFEELQELDDEELGTGSRVDVTNANSRDPRLLQDENLRGRARPLCIANAEDDPMTRNTVLRRGREHGADTRANGDLTVGEPSSRHEASRFPEKTDSANSQHYEGNDTSDRKRKSVANGASDARQPNRPTKKPRFDLNALKQAALRGLKRAPPKTNPRRTNLNYIRVQQPVIFYFDDDEEDGEGQSSSSRSESTSSTSQKSEDARIGTGQQAAISSADCDSGPVSTIGEMNSNNSRREPNGSGPPQPVLSMSEKRRQLWILRRRIRDQEEQLRIIALQQGTAACVTETPPEITEERFSDGAAGKVRSDTEVNGSGHGPSHAKAHPREDLSEMEQLQRKIAEAEARKRHNKLISEKEALRQRIERLETRRLMATKRAQVAESEPDLKTKHPPSTAPLDAAKTSQSGPAQPTRRSVNAVSKTTVKVGDDEHRNQAKGGQDATSMGSGDRPQLIEGSSEEIVKPGEKTTREEIRPPSALRGRRYCDVPSNGTKLQGRSVSMQAGPAAEKNPPGIHDPLSRAAQCSGPSPWNQRTKPSPERCISGSRPQSASIEDTVRTREAQQQPTNSGYVLLFMSSPALAVG